MIEADFMSARRAQWVWYYLLFFRDAPDACGAAERKRLKRLTATRKEERGDSHAGAKSSFKD
jgi:hypothetical protein